MTEREKIAQIIAEHLCPQGRAHKTLYGAERICYSRNNFADCEKVSECVDALAEAGIGDVKSLVDGNCVLCVKDKGCMRLYPEGDIKELEHRAEVAEKEREEYKHRAFRAERALENIEGICSRYIQQAEREIEGDKK